MGFWKTFDIGMGINDFLNNYFGFLEDSVTVRIAGGPRSTKRQLYNLAASVAFGMAKPHIQALGGANVAPGSIGIEYSAERMDVVFVLKFSRSLKSVVATIGLDGVRNLPVFAGPEDTVVGDNFLFRPPVPGGVAPDSLVFANKTLLTTNPRCSDPNPALAVGPEIKTPNPRPTGDARSRGTLQRLVFTALSTPAGSNQTFNPPTDPDRFAGK